MREVFYFNVFVLSNSLGVDSWFKVDSELPKRVLNELKPMVSRLRQFSSLASWEMDTIESRLRFSLGYLSNYYRSKGYAVEEVFYRRSNRMMYAILRIY